LLRKEISIINHEVNTRVIFKKEDKFSIHLRKMSSHLVESMNYFAEYQISNKEDLKEFAKQMKLYETEADQLVHQIIHDLNKVFITPIEREDILALATTMDDVLDGLEGIAALLEMFRITSVDDFVIQFIVEIKKCVEEIDKAIDLMADKKLLEMREHVINIKDYEAKCDDIRRVSIKHLFDNEKDPIAIIQYKEIYEELEEVADYCEKVANTFDAIIMKNA